MTATLLRKEFDQHWRALLVLTVLTLGGMALVSEGTQATGAAGSVFEGLHEILRLLMPLTAMVLSHRLVALEFRQKTQLFLEALPLPRWRMVAVKYLFGLAVILLLAGGALALACEAARATENLTPRFLAIVSARSIAWAWWCYSFLFLTGFLGRYRIFFYLSFGFGLLMVHTFSDIRLAEFGPFALMDARFAYENSVVPSAALRVTLFLSAGFTVLSFAMALVREGTVAALLGEKMSHREKMFLAATFAVGLAAFEILSERHSKDPFDLPSAIEEARGSVAVKVGFTADTERRRAGLLAGRTADELEALRDYVGADDLPPVFIVSRPEFGPKQFELGKIEEGEGLLARANFHGAEFDERAFLTWLVREVIVAHTHGRADMEHKVWVLHGFLPLWENRADLLAPLGNDAVRLAQAAAALECGFGAGDLTRWLSLEKRCGNGQTRALAWAALKSLAQRHGADACRGFIRSVLGGEVPHDVRATWRDWRQPVPRLLEAAAGVSIEQFITGLRDEVQTARHAAGVAASRGETGWKPASPMAASNAASR